MVEVMVQAGRAHFCHFWLILVPRELKLSKVTSDLQVKEKKEQPDK